MFETRGVKFETVIKHIHLQTCIASEAVSIASVSPMNCSQIYKKKKQRKSEPFKEKHMHKPFVVVQFCFVRPPGLELNLTSSAFLGTLTLTFLLVSILK